MKAFVYKQYGRPEVLTLEDVEKPSPKENEVLIKVHALSINPAEWHQLKGVIWMIRLTNGLLKPRQNILGADVAGMVVAVGKKVQSFQVGDRIFGRNFTGGLAAYACLEEDKAAHLPDNLTFEQAAAIPLASVTALIALRDKGAIQPGMKVLINGASGGIGTFAVQLASYYQAQVTGVCSGKNAPLVYSLGADHVIDYLQEDFTKALASYDLIIDLVGNRSVNELNNILRPEGRCVMVGFSNFKNLLGFIVRGGWLSQTSNKEFLTMDANTRKEDLTFISQLVSEGKIKPVIMQLYPFESVPAAFQRLGTRRAKGKIVIKLLQS